MIIPFITKSAKNTILTGGQHPMNDVQNFIQNFNKFDIIYDRWIKHPVFLESVSELVGPEHGIAHKEVRDALKEYCKLIIKCQEAYEETRNNLGMYWRNLIGSIVVSHREPDYYKNTIKQIYKYIIPVKTEIDTFASKTEELASEYRNEKS